MPIDSEQVQILLCDWADVINGKMYVQGGGWTWIAVATPVQIAVAVYILVPWTETNVPMNFKLSLTMDGQEVSQQTAEGLQPVLVEGQFGVGRPMGVRQGSPLAFPMAMRFGPLVLQPGPYEFELRINGEPVKKVGFEAVLPQFQSQPFMLPPQPLS